MALLVVAVLMVGIVAGAGTNLLFGKPKVEKASSNSSQETPAENEGKSAGAGRKGDSATPRFSMTQAMAHVSALSERIGARPAGSIKESSAAEYIGARLGEYGYSVEEQQFTMADGYGSRNIVGTRRGTRDGYTMIIAAHYDGPRESAGAIDNASGVGVVLELARAFSVRRIKSSIQFVFFGGNHPGAADPDSRLVGARRFVELLGSLEKREIVGMIAVDCVGQGETLAVRTQGTGLQRLKDKMETFARRKNIAVTYIKSNGESDNIPFEDSNVPAVWVEWCDSSGLLSTDNRYASVVPQKVESAGVLIEGFTLGLSLEDLDDLKY
ncbi:MAG: hypothetical protein CVT63_05400 [Candidatus Anoxymicrobium japonicum]|uniref:Peptidase M28 domain-containing protein n=1 Tax=Candidatus Anoxymicrobium japonicum TaxID=2013648 RepID=A0A2N3G5C5_9ACTN|nr:MAG: hypothetical protein CVT63_05400 [Candidatus Anoxymicrobium japonicum]